MPLQYTNNGNGTVDVSLFYDNINKIKADATLLEAARYVYNVMGQGTQVDANGVLVPFDNLTNAQRLQLVFNAVTGVVKSWAITQHKLTEQEAARQQAEIDANALYDLA